MPTAPGAMPAAGAADAPVPIMAHSQMTCALRTTVWRVSVETPFGPGGPRETLTRPGKTVAPTRSGSPLSVL